MEASFSPPMSTGLCVTPARLRERPTILTTQIEWKEIEKKPIWFIDQCSNSLDQWFEAIPFFDRMREQGEAGLLDRTATTRPVDDVDGRQRQ
jgi:hypothetical protein